MQCLTLRDRLAAIMIPLVRAYVRYVPVAFGKQALWFRLIGPRLAWKPHRFVARTVFGSRIAGTTEELLQQYIYYFGVWEPDITRWIRRRLAPGDTFVDVGANVGYYSLLASKLVGPSGRVVAIEASQRIFEQLRENLARNRVRNVRAIHAAVADSQGMVKVFRGPDCHIGLSTILEEEAQQHGYPLECEVRAAPLCTLLEAEELRTTRLIKIDVEGAEWAVTNGLRPLLDGGRPDLEITMEINPQRLAQLGKEPDDLLRLFRSAGFHAYRLENDYSPARYLSPLAQEKAVRMRDPLDHEMDIAFSREDAEYL